MSTSIVVLMLIPFLNLSVCWDGLLTWLSTFSFPIFHFSGSKELPEQVWRQTESTAMDTMNTSDDKPESQEKERQRRNAPHILQEPAWPSDLGVRRTGFYSCYAATLMCDIEQGSVATPTLSLSSLSRLSRPDF